MKMVGDDLTITLFLISLAGSVAVGGISQAGWKNRPLIASLFVFAAVLFVAGIGWPWLKDFSPSVKPIVVALATSPVAWFVMLMFGLGAALFMPRLRKDAPASALDEMASNDHLRTQGSQQQPARILVLEDVCPEFDNRPSTEYQRKVRIVVRNDSRKDIIVYAARWEPKTGGIVTRALPPPGTHPWQIEGAGRELYEVHSPPGQMLHTWIGLQMSADEVDVRRRTVTKRLGTLVVPLRVDGSSIPDERIDL